MEEYSMVEVWKLKLRELRLQKAMMRIDKKFSSEDLDEMDKNIEYVRKELAKAMLEEKKEEKVTSIGKRS